MWLHYHNRVWLKILPRNRLTTVSILCLPLQLTLMPVIPEVRGSGFTESNVIVHRNETGAKKNVNNQHKNEQKPMLTKPMSGNALQILQDSTVFFNQCNQLRRPEVGATRQKLTNTGKKILQQQASSLAECHHWMWYLHTPSGSARAAINYTHNH